jgi:hypothetical protein
MTGKSKFERFLARHPHPHPALGARPALARRHFFSLAAAGLTGSWLARPAAAQQVRIHDHASVETIGRARNVLFILLSGAPSHIDTFDFKQTPDTPLELLKPEADSGVVWPVGLLPRLGTLRNRFAIVRSMRSWALVHGLAQTWAQIGRSPVAALGNIAPNIGSIVAVEKEAQRSAGQFFPGFIALNSASAPGEGYLSSAYAPFRVTPAAGGLRNTTNPDDATGAGRFAAREALLASLDGPLRANSPYGTRLEDMDAFYKAARGLMYNPVVNQAFTFTTLESAAYGNSAFGNACLVARKILALNQGTRFVQITFGGWDHHTQIYAANNLPRLARMLDEGLAQLLTELDSSGLLQETLVVMAGEFGRTTGALSAALGRDHWLQHFAVLAGAGVRGGRVLGATDATGKEVREAGWSRNREVRAEDLEATIYSALGINWTRVRYDDPFGRGFSYVPYSEADLYGPLHELWA